MTRLPRKLEELSRALIDLDTEAMLIEELDGFIAGLIVCPEMIPPSAWLPWTWNRQGDEGRAGVQGPLTWGEWLSDVTVAA